MCRGGPSSREGNSVAALESVAHGLAWDFLRMKRVWAQACGVRKATSLVVLVNCSRGQEVNMQASPGTLTRQRCWQGRGWPGSPDPALAPGWPGTLRAVKELWENTAGCGGLAGSSQGVGGHPSFPPSSTPRPTLLHDLTSPWVSVWMDGAESWDALAPRTLSPASWGLGDWPLPGGAGSSPCPGRHACSRSSLHADVGSGVEELRSRKQGARQFSA
ncbi:unnamed protein product [Rangifer tarandus platyrhynchus]|uniref:Uncharacterized protein n=2 Tax=Rangifer tarandus platyrhynchus TaxID=3082113 RepID=A0ABN8YDY3_RANTA|nr:unnamed protein product [Rangifer tarandus platyrhynchus]